jgi:hypothetical protein
MIRKMLNASRLQEEVSRRINRMHSLVEEGAKIRVPRPRLCEPDKTGCNWEMKHFGSAAGFERDIEAVLKAVQAEYNLSTEANEADHPLADSPGASEAGNPFAASTGAQEAGNPFAASTATKDAANPFAASPATKDAANPLAASPATKDAGDPFAASPGSQDAGNPFADFPDSKERG